MRSGAPGAAAGLLRRALSEPPRREQRVVVLREAARAEASAGREAACVRWRRRCAWLRIRGSGPRSPWRWPRRTRRCSGGPKRSTSSNRPSRSSATPTTGWRPGSRANWWSARSRRPPGGAGRAGARAAIFPVAVGQCGGGACCRPGDGHGPRGSTRRQAAAPLEEALRHAAPRAENWDTRAALLWSLITAERFEAVETALETDAGRRSTVRQCPRSGGRVQRPRFPQAPPRCSARGRRRRPGRPTGAPGGRLHPWSSLRRHRPGRRRRRGRRA